MDNDSLGHADGAALQTEVRSEPPAHFSASPAPTLESQPRRIRPLGDQIIIRVFPPSSVGSIILPDSAKGSTHQGEKGDFVHFVEAEVVAVGPGRRGKESGLIDKLADALEYYADPPRARTDLHDDAEFYRLKMERNRELIRRARKDSPIPLQVKPGDRILYHPSVQRFDRKIDPAMIGLPDTEECYIVSEQTSVLAVLERE
jgi:co-chaperonin GroES (HSP10)